MFRKIIFFICFLSAIRCIAQPNLSFSENEEKEAVQKVFAVLKGLDLKPFQRLNLNLSSFRLKILVDTSGNSLLDSIYTIRDTAVTSKLKDGIRQHLKMTPFVFEGEKLPYTFVFSQNRGASTNEARGQRDESNLTDRQGQQWVEGMTCSLGFGANLPVGNANRYSSMALGIEGAMYLRFAKKWGAGFAVGQAQYSKKQDLPIATAFPQQSSHNLSYISLYAQRVIKKYKRKELLLSLDCGYALRTVAESTNRNERNVFLQGVTTGFGLKYRMQLGKPGTGYANFLAPFGLEAFLTVRPFFLNYTEANGTAITLGIGYTVGADF